MSKQFGTLLGTVALAALLPAVAQAQSDGSYLTNGPYVSLQGGGSLPLDGEFDEGVAGKSHFNGGWTALGGVGYGFGNGLRLELQGGIWQNDVSNLTDSLGKYPGSGKLRVIPLTVNAIYDFDTGTPWIPHIGAGAGAANVNVRGIGPIDGSMIDGDQNVFAYQAILGIDYAVAPQLKVGFDYHFAGVDSGGYSATPAGTRAAANFQTNLLTIGLRWEFGEPEQIAAAPPPPPPPTPAPPPPAPAPEAARSFQVFFDFDKSEITAAASKVIQSAADAVRNGHVVQITVTGHTDTVGSASYNQALSERRATAVKQTLVTDGVSDGEITTIGVGKTGLLVPTADGVREPQNRRAEIVLQ